MAEPPRREVWVHVGTVELGQNVLGLVDIVADPSIQFLAETSIESPPGFQWIELFVDESRGTRHCVQTMCALLTTLQRLAAKGVLPDFRIISGEHWLAVGAELAIQDVQAPPADEK